MSEIVRFPNMYAVDLTDGPAIVQLNQMFMGDVLANRIGAYVTNNRANVSLSGTVSGTAILSDGSTVAIPGTASGNMAYIDLPSGAYSVPGPIRVTVKFTAAGVTATLVEGFGNVTQTETGTVIDPGTIIPSVSALISAIDTAVESIPQDYSTLSANMNALTHVGLSITGNYIAPGGAQTANAEYNCSDFIPVNADSVLILRGFFTGTSSGSALVYAFYDASKAFISGQNGISTDTTVTTIPSGAAYVRFSSRVSQGETPAAYVSNHVVETLANLAPRMDDAEADVADLKSASNKFMDFAGAEYPNRLDVSGAPKTGYGITISLNDGKAVVNGTTTGAGVLKIGNIIPLESSPLLFSGIPNTASSSTFGIRYIHGSTIADHYADWTISTAVVGDTYDIYLKFTNGYTFNNLVLPLMATFNYSGGFIAFGDFYLQETAQEMVDNALSEVDAITGYTKPNLFKNDITTKTENGVTFTVNSDGSVSVTGTATANTYVQQNITLKQGTYILTGVSGGASNTYHILYTSPSTGNSVYQTGNPTTIICSAETEITFYIRVMSGVTVDTVVYPMIRPATVYNPTYAPYGEYQIYKPIQELIDYTEFNWSGKKMNVIGDSIVQGSYGNFINVIRDILCLSEARNYGVGGSCLASSDQDTDYTPAVLRYENMDLDAQIIIVHAGTNDYSAQIPLGDADSTDITTFNGALNVMMDGLREMYPTALIIFDSILHRFNDGALTIKASQYRQCIEDRCLANHIVFYDCFKYSGFDFGKGYYDHILTSDGLHPNQIGANILGRKLAGFIRWN